MTMNFVTTVFYASLTRVYAILRGGGDKGGRQRTQVGVSKQRLAERRDKLGAYFFDGTCLISYF